MAKISSLSLKPEQQASLATTNTEQYVYGLGRRKSASARVRLQPGKGNVSVNGAKLNEYFTRSDHQTSVLAPLKLVAKHDLHDVSVLVDGGGITGQAEAVRLGIARALAASDEAVRVTLKKAGFLTRDSRVTERKKYGLKSARRAPQWSKR